MTLHGHSRSRCGLLEKRAALADIRERFVVLKHKLEGGDAAQRIARQIVGKLDLGIAAVDEQLKALESFENDPHGPWRKPPTSSPKLTATIC